VIVASFLITVKEVVVMGDDDDDDNDNKKTKLRTERSRLK